MGDLRSTLQTTLGDAYQIERELGGGGMSRVFVATETSLARRVVIKVLPPELAAGVSIDRFRREIALAASMQHPHIVPLLAAGGSAEPLWYSMPYIEGQSLRARLSRGGELPIPDAVRILREVADALAYAHRHGVVHRDIKPENVLLSEGHAMVMDFGVAKAIVESSARGTLVTEAGVALGTPTYMAPEQASADPHVDQRADIYAFGILAFELLTGLPPFSGTSAVQVVRAHLAETAPSVLTRRDGVPPQLGELVARCLAKRAADRPQSAEELVTALDTLTTPSGAVPYSAGAGAPMALWARRRTWTIATIAALVVIVGGMFAIKRYARGPVRPRVVVAPFTNATGDKDFDELGTIIASWVQDAFTRSATLDVADFRSLTIATRNAKAVAIGSGPTGLRAYAEAAGATRVLTGSIFKLGDSLEIRATIVDPKAGTVVVSVAPVRALAKEPMPGVELLAERAAGALAATSEGATKFALVGAPHLPTLAAYREFNAGVEAYQVNDWQSAITHFKASIAADSAFLTPEVWLALAYGNFRLMSESTIDLDSVMVLMRALDRRRAELSPLDQAVVEYQIAARTGQPDRALAALRRAATLWPDRWATNLIQTLVYHGRPREALELAKTVDPTKGFLRGWALHYSQLVQAYWLAGDLEGALKVAAQGRRQFPDRVLRVCDHATALGVLGRLQEADSLLNFVLPSVGARSKEAEFDCRASYLGLVVALGPDSVAQTVVRSWLAFLSSPAGLPANARIWGLGNGMPSWRWGIALGAALLGDVMTARAIADSLAAEQPNSRLPRLQAAWVQALGGDTAASFATEQAALALPAPSEDFGGTEIWRAIIAAGRGDRDGAVWFAREASRRGAGMFSYFSPQLRSLHGYPPFEALIVR